MRVRSFALILVLILAAAGIAIPASAQERIPLRVRLGDVSINKVPFVVAFEEGIYEKNGLDVDQFISPGAAEVMRRSGVAVPRQYVRELDNRAPIGIGGGTPTIVSRTTNARSLGRIIIATTDHISRWHIVAQPEITTPEQLKGKRLGFSGVGAMTHFIARVFVERMGWDPTHDISLMSQALGLDTLQNRAVDAFVADEIAYAMARKAGYQPLLDVRPWNVPIAGSGVHTTESWLRENRETARRFIKATVEAIALMKKDKEVAFRAMEKWYGIKDREVQGMIYAGAVEMPRKPYPSVAGLKRTMEIYDSNEMRKHKVEDFYDDSLVRELDESGYIDSLYQ